VGSGDSMPYALFLWSGERGGLVSVPWPKCGHDQFNRGKVERHLEGVAHSGQGPWANRTTPSGVLALCTARCFEPCSNGYVDLHSTDLRKLVIP
jgi:hypothetical protein